MPREIRLNAFEMNCVGHQSPGLWAHPRDRSSQYKDLEYWTDLARLLERGRFDGLFIADVLGIYDVLDGNLRLPVRILAGDSDGLTPAERGRALHERLVDSQFEVLERCGHQLMLERPEVVNRHLRELLGRI